MVVYQFSPPILRWWCWSHALIPGALFALNLFPSIFCFASVQLTFASDRRYFTIPQDSIFSIMASFMTRVNATRLSFDIPLYLHRVSLGRPLIPVVSMWVLRFWYGSVLLHRSPVDSWWQNITTQRWSCPGLKDRGAGTMSWHSTTVSEH